MYVNSREHRSSFVATKKQVQGNVREFTRTQIICQLFGAVMLGASFSWSTPALFYELAVEIAYPVPEGIVGGHIAVLSNISTVIFFLVYLLPGIGIMWMNYCLFLYSVASVVTMLMVDEQYNRLAVDHNKRIEKKN